MSERNLQPPTPSTEELVEARERADAGHRLMFPQLFERQADTDRADGLGADKCTGCEWVESDYAPHYIARADCPLHGDLAPPSEAEGLMADLEQEIDEAGRTLGKLLERLDLPERSLAAAVFNRFGVDFVELWEQLPTLREAVRERGGVDA